MSSQDRVRLVQLVDTALALSSLEIGQPPRVSFNLYSAGPQDAQLIQFVFEINHNDLSLFERDLAPLVEDPTMRDLLLSALAELGPAHDDFRQQMLAQDGSDLDIELERRGLSGAGLNLKEGGQRRSIDQYRKPQSWLSRRKWFRSTLKWTDIVLGSLSSIPCLGVAVDPLKEWKEAVEAQLETESGRRGKH